MKNTKLTVAIMAGVMGLAVQAHAQMYDITFDIDGNDGSGVLTATANGDGTYLVTSASVLVTSGSWSSATPYILAPNGDNDGTFGLYGQSSEGHFSGGADMIYDNILYPGSPLTLDSDGLGFWTTSGTAGLGFNLFGVNTFYGLGQLGNPVVSDGTIDIVAVPEPTTVIAGALLLLPFGASTLRVLRKNRMA